MNYRTVLIVLPLLALIGCASKLPKEIVEKPENGISLAIWQAAPTEHAQARVRWGGTILRIENHRDETWIEVLESPLDNHGRPTGGSSEGRFIIKVKGFLDPELYPLRRLITSAGVVEGEIERPIGDHPYRYPLLISQLHHLWPAEPPKKRSLTNGILPQGPWSPLVDDYADEYIPF